MGSFWAYIFDFFGLGGLVRSRSPRELIERRLPRAF
jgi:hypothetical protein